MSKTKRKVSGTSPSSDLDRMVEREFERQDRRLLLLCMDYLEKRDDPYVLESLVDLHSLAWDNYVRMN